MKTDFEEIFEVAQDISLAALFWKRVGGYAAREEFDWVFDESTFPGTLATIGEIWWGTGTEGGKSGARTIGDSKWGT